MGLLSAAAGRADIPVFPVVGAGGRQATEDLSLLPGIRLVASPRAAVVLIVIGRLTRALVYPAMLAHDQMPGPRATAWWPGAGTEDSTDAGGDLLAALPGVVTIAPDDEGAWRALFADLVAGRRPSDPPALADIESPRWRGVGPHGHGGEGMMGGVPYGRPFAEMRDDPDGLMLDQLPLQVGPLFPAFPPGLILHLGLAGDVIRGVVVGDNPYRSWPGDPEVGPLDTAPFVQALRSPTTVAALELARARHHLRWLARTLRLHGLEARGRRIGALAQALSVDDRGAVETLARRLGRDRGLAAATSGVGLVDQEAMKRSGTQPGGPVARAAGLEVDARTGDPTYASLDFEPVLHDGGDARARLRQRATEAAQSLVLAERAGDLVRAAGGPVEGPRGALTPGATMPSSALITLLPGLLDGLEWGDAVTTVASLDLDLEEAAIDRSPTPRSPGRGPAASGPPATSAATS